MAGRKLSEILDNLDTGQELLDYSITNQDYDLINKIKRGDDLDDTQGNAKSK